MLLCEHADKLDRPPAIQVFATDLDENAIQHARDASYTETIAADVSEERLRRFFTREHGGYRIKREIRELVLFALHDLLKDSPFSRLDMVTCRNLLIYLNQEAQDRALEIFHFSLASQGTLFLGSSESTEEGNNLFTAMAASEERLHLIIENAREFAIFSTDLDLRVTSWNPGAERLLGYAEREILGQSAEIVFVPEDRAAGGGPSGASWKSFRSGWICTPSSATPWR